MRVFTSDPGSSLEGLGFPRIGLASARRGPASAGTARATVRHLTLVVWRSTGSYFVFQLIERKLDRRSRWTTAPGKEALSRSVPGEGGALDHLGQKNPRKAALEIDSWLVWPRLPELGSLGSLFAALVRAEGFPVVYTRGAGSFRITRSSWWLAATDGAANEDRV